MVASADRLRFSIELVVEGIATLAVMFKLEVIDVVIDDAADEDEAREAISFFFLHKLDLA